MRAARYLADASALAIAAALQTNDGDGSMKSLQREVIAWRWDDR